MGRILLLPDRLGAHTAHNSGVQPSASIAFGFRMLDCIQVCASLYQ
jgi:hypothetical protein